MTLSGRFNNLYDISSLFGAQQFMDIQHLASHVFPITLEKMKCTIFYSCKL